MVDRNLAPVVVWFKNKNNNNKKHDMNIFWYMATQTSKLCLGLVLNLLRGGGKIDFINELNSNPKPYSRVELFPLNTKPLM